MIEGQVNTDTSFPLPTGSEIILGREPSCDIPLNAYTNISRRHASIRPAHPGNWVIYDLNSSNGTYINGIRLQGGQVLRPGDRIHLSQNGPEFLFEYENPIPVTSAPQYKHQVVSQSRTIIEVKYSLILFPRRLVIDCRTEHFIQDLLFFLCGCLLWLFVLIGLVVLGFMFSLVQLLIPAFIMFVMFVVIVWLFALFMFLVRLFQQQTIDYIFDLETNLLTIHYQRGMGEILNRKYGSKQYSLQDFTAIRLQRTEYEDDEGERFDGYTIFLDRKKGRALRLTFADYKLAQAQQIIDIIEQYLSHVEV